jgi:methylated-DNA-[protein]-cysteine S-methyltransferase
VVAENDALTGLYFEHHRRRPAAEALGTRSDEGFEEVRRQLGQYFTGERHDFDLSLAPAGEEFQQRVWGLLRQIPYGQRRSYGELARRLGDASLAQALGAANGSNPLSVLIPCHRVIGANGKLIGYAGGLERKRHLLHLEQPADPGMAGMLF